MYFKDEIFVGVTPLSKELDYLSQSVYNVFPLILARSKETKEAYRTISPRLHSDIEKLLCDGLQYEQVKYNIQFVWTSDLHTFWLISEHISYSHNGNTCFCPYCMATVPQRAELNKEKRIHWDNVVSSALNDPWLHFVFCILHADCRGSERLIQLTYMILVDNTSKLVKNPLFIVREQTHSRTIYQGFTRYGYPNVLY